MSARKDENEDTAPGSVAEEVTPLAEDAVSGTGGEPTEVEHSVAVIEEDKPAKTLTLSKKDRHREPNVFVAQVRRK